MAAKTPSAAKAKTGNATKKTASAPGAPDGASVVSAAAADSSASPASTGNPADAENTITALIVSAKAEGFRRAGRAWSKAPTTVPVEELDGDQVQALLAEPALDVVAVAEK